jgi:hypothetical protein
MKINPIYSEIFPERRTWNFARIAEEMFCFLSRYGFTLEVSSPTLVQYRRGNIVANIYHGRKSFELGFEVEHTGKKYSISELMRDVNPEQAKKYRNFTATTHQGLMNGLSHLAGVVKKYGRKLLSGNDDMLFDRLENQRKIWARDYALEVLEKQILPRAHAAFTNKDYATVVTLLSKIETRITGSDRKKLDFARKHLTRSTKRVP